MTILEPADVPLAGIPAPAVALVILAAAILLFSYVMFRRIQILRVRYAGSSILQHWRKNSLDARLWVRPMETTQVSGSGILHILLFAGFMILSLRSLTLIGRGFSSQFHLPLLTGSAAFSYEVLKDYVVLMVLAVCIVAIVRRAVFRPAALRAQPRRRPRERGIRDSGIGRRTHGHGYDLRRKCPQDQRKGRPRGPVSCGDTCRPIYVRARFPLH